MATTSYVYDDINEELLLKWENSYKNWGAEAFSSTWQSNFTSPTTSPTLTTLESAVEQAVRELRGDR